MNKRVVLLFGCVVVSILSYGQSLQLRYLNSNGEVVDFATSQVSSDYGKRNLSSGSFHNGVDFAAPLGTPLLSLVDGTVSFITSFKQIAIRGNDGNHFSYMHIFNDAELDADGTLRIGNFVFVRLTEPVRYTILNLSTGVAIGTDTRDTIIYNSTKYPVQNKVVKGQAIAPAGVSGCPGCGSHLHLFRLVNPSGNTTISSFNTVNPLQVVNHAQPEYNITFNSIPYRLTTVNSGKFYPGNASSSVSVKVQMQNANSTTNNNSFTNVTMNVDKVTLFIKKDYEDSARYDTIRGIYYLSKIAYGGMLSKGGAYERIYPARMSGDLQPFANNSISGVEPHAYSGGDYDVFYFSDIYTRLHRSYITGTVPEKFAICNAEAMYPDGKYNIYSQLTTITDEKYHNYSNPLTIIVDNFRPYIEKIEIARQGETIPFYSRGWTWDGTALKLGLASCPVQADDKNLVVYVYTSEPMQYIKVTAMGLMQQKTTPDDVTRKKWSFIFAPPVSPVAVRNYIVVEGTDFAGNPIEGFVSENATTAIPVRQDSISWLPKPLVQKDSVHYYQVASGTVSAAFTGTATFAGDVAGVQFINNSTGSYISSYWVFGDGSSGTETNPLHAYSTSGVFNVKLTVSDCVSNSVKEISSYLTLLPYIAKVEIGSSVKDTVLTEFERNLTNGVFDFRTEQKSLDAQSGVKIKVFPSGPLQKLGIVVKNGQDEVIFTALKEETAHDNSKVFEFTVSANKLSSGTHYFYFYGADFGGNNLLKQDEPLYYPYKLMEGTGGWSNDTTGLTGSDNNYYFYVRQTTIGDNEILLYPNPTRGRFTIESNVNIKTIEVFTIQGKFLGSLRVRNSFREIDLITYPAGIYLLKITTVNSVIIKKVILHSTE